MSARRFRVLPGSGLTCQLIWSYGDPLRVVPPREVPALGMAPELDRVPMGRTEDGETWMLPLRWHTLTAGASGAGKGSVLWSLMVSLAPQVHAGLIEVHGIDLKGGTELAMGRGLFTRLATKPEEAVVLLEEAASTCRARAEKMAGNTRLHEPTTKEPLVIVLIDEMASLTAYLPDKKLIARAEDALSTLLSIGRAPGFYVYGFLQDPRKEVLKMRNLFLQSVGLRLNSREEVSMVLGDGALKAGARCHKISKDMPGIGYVIEDGGRPVRVRASYVTDDVIRSTAKTFPTPRVVRVVVPTEPEPTPRASRSSAPRTTTPRASRRKAKDTTPPKEDQE